MYTKILVPLDGSDLSQAVLPYVLPIASALKIPVTLLHVIDPEIISTLSGLKRGQNSNAVVADLRQRSAEYLENSATQIRFGTSVENAVEIGDPATVIADRASTDSGTLIAMVTHGRSGVERWLLGSVADKVLHAATNPLFLVRPINHRDPSPEVALKKVVVPLDGSPLAESVLPHVTLLAQKMNLDVILLRVCSLVNAGSMIENETYASTIEMVLDELKEEAKQYLEGKVRDLKGQGVKNVSYAVPVGEAAGDIISLGKKTSDNLIAMCTHGRSGVGRWVLGSVTDRVVRHSGDPVLIIRAARS